MTNVNHIFRLITAAIVLLMVSGCGFQLRGSGAAAAALPSVHVIASGPTAEFAPVLTRNMRQAGAQIAAARSDAGVVVDIVDLSRSRRALGASSSGNTRDYQIAYQLSYRLSREDGSAIADSQVISAQRNLIVNESAVLSSASTEEMVVRDLLDDLANQLIRRIQASIKP